MNVPGLTDSERQSLEGRIVLCRKTEVVPIECIARGYITGSGWRIIKTVARYAVLNCQPVCGIRIVGRATVHALHQGG